MISVVEGMPVPQVRSTPEKWSLGDLLALQALQPLITSYIPWTSWSMRPSAVASVVNDVMLRQRRTVVELGAGSSTLVLARAVQLTEGTLVSIEHDAGFAAALNRQLRAAGLADRAAVHHVPLTPFPAADAPSGGRSAPTTWYDVEGLRSVTPEGIDLLIVDGPPAGDLGDVLVREPAVRVLRDRFATSYSVFLDDAEREPERETLALWEQQLGIPFLIVDRLTLGVGSTDGGFTPTL
ncbi:class I SAM-dependent methyltransferase [Actinoplanes sp. NPDC051859]|uniref:class I SAM-dependent methyltransferase n=1 Tax=Actinoplanes sp. NPDC051859 TaxID=3363909 RepID=UPI0037ADC109